MDSELNPKLALLCSLSEAQSLQEITDKAFELLGNPIFIADTARTILAYTKVVEVNDDLWQRRIIHGELYDNSWKQTKEVHQLHVDSTKAHFPVFTKDSESSCPCAVKTIMVKGCVHGDVVLLGVFKEIDDTDLHLLELLSVYVSQLMASNLSRYSQNEREVEHFLVRLLDGTAYSPEQVKNHLKVLNWSMQPILYVMLIRPDRYGSGNSIPSQVLTQLSVLPHCRTLLYDGAVVLIYSRDSMISSWEEDEPQLCAQLSEWSVLAGISSGFRDMSQIGRYYQEAVAALRLGERLREGQDLYSYDEFTFYHLLEKAPPSVHLREFCHEKILALEEYETAQGGDLLITLQLYLEFSKNLTRTAEALHVHRNTVRYRIDKCMKIAQTGFENGNEIFSFILSLRILEFERRRHLEQSAWKNKTSRGLLRETND